ENGLRIQRGRVKRYLFKPCQRKQKSATKRMRHPTGRRLMEMLRNPQPRKPLHRGKGRRAGRRRQKKKNRASVTKRFAFGPISFPNNGSASQFRAKIGRASCRERVWLAA